MMAKGEKRPNPGNDWETVSVLSTVYSDNWTTQQVMERGRRQHSFLAARHHPSHQRESAGLGGEAGREGETYLDSGAWRV